MALIWVIRKVMCKEGGRVEGSEEVRYGGVTEGGGKKEGSEECKE